MLLLMLHLSFAAFGIDVVSEVAAAVEKNVGKSYVSIAAKQTPLLSCISEEKLVTLAESK